MKYIILITMVTFFTTCDNTIQTKTPKPELLDRELFFGNPEKIQVRISPDGKYLSYTAPVDGVMNVWVAPIDDPDAAEPVTKDSVRGVRNYGWTYKTGNLLYVQDFEGDENFHVYKVDVKNGNVTDLTPHEEIISSDQHPLTGSDGKPMRPRANILSVSKDKPNEILVQMNLSDPTLMDVHKVNLETGKMSLLEKDEGFLQIVPDNNHRIRLATKMNPDGGQIVYKKSDVGWEEYFKVPQQDMLTFGFMGFDKSNNKVYLIDSRGRDKSALYSLDLMTDQKKIIAENDKADIINVIQNPVTDEIDAYAINYLTTEWIPLNEETQADFDKLGNTVSGELSIHTRTEGDLVWVYSVDAANESLKYYKYDKPTGQTKLMVNSRPALDEVLLSNTYPVEIKTRDDLKLVSYLTLPTAVDNNGKATEAVPMVLLVHGGPWARDAYGFMASHQWLANRGYAVLSVNYRGSTGFGKNFINIAAGEWAGKMHDDLLDAVDWAINEGIALKDKVAIMGGSYGGYAALVGLTFTPDVFACGVDIVGPSNLNTLLSTIPPYWKAFRDVFTYHIGDPETESGMQLLEERSPLNKVDNIKKPLLIGQGANDPRVKQSESDQIVNAMKAKQIPVTYILYPDEGHGFARPENRLSFYAVSEAFLAKHLGGKSQPIDGDFEKSSLEVIEAGNLTDITVQGGSSE